MITVANISNGVPPLARVLTAFSGDVESGTYSMCFSGSQDDGSPLSDGDEYDIIIKDNSDNSILASATFVLPVLDLSTATPKAGTDNNFTTNFQPWLTSGALNPTNLEDGTACFAFTKKAWAAANGFAGFNIGKELKVCVKSRTNLESAEAFDLIQKIEFVGFANMNIQIANDIPAGCDYSVGTPGKGVKFINNLQGSNVTDFNYDIDSDGPDHIFATPIQFEEILGIGLDQLDGDNMIHRDTATYKVNPGACWSNCPQLAVMYQFTKQLGNTDQTAFDFFIRTGQPTGIVGGNIDFNVNTLTINIGVAGNPANVSTMDVSLLQIANESGSPSTYTNYPILYTISTSPGYTTTTTPISHPLSALSNGQGYYRMVGTMEGGNGFATFRCWLLYGEY